MKKCVSGHILLILILVLSGCLTYKTRKIINADRIDTIYLNEIELKILDQKDTANALELHKQIALKFENKSNEVIRLSDPNCTINLVIKVFENNLELPILELRESDTQCLNKKISIKPNENYMMTYSLGELFKIKPSHSYKVEAYYSGVIKSNNRTLKSNDKYLHSFSIIEIP